MRYLRSFTALCLACCFAFACFAADTIVFSRTTLAIVPRAEEELPPAKEAAPEKEEKKDPLKDERRKPGEKPAIAKPPRQKHVFTVEVRQGQPDASQGMFIRTPLTQSNATLFVLGKPDRVPLEPGTIYAPVDVLFVGEDGGILQILPNVKLSELEETVIAEKPVKAFLHLKAGTVEKWDIRPGDQVEYDVFRKKQLIIN